MEGAGIHSLSADHREEHHKLSKRCGHSSYEDLIDQGFVTEAVVNFVALLGWSPADNQER